MQIDIFPTEGKKCESMNLTQDDFTFDPLTLLSTLYLLSYQGRPPADTINSFIMCWNNANPFNIFSKYG